MAMPISPCYGCDKRIVGCHSDCLGYAIYRVEMAEYNGTIKKAKTEERKRKDYDFEAFKKRKW